MRADIKPKLFEDLIKYTGMKVLWEEAMFCHCLNKDSGQPDFNCPYCEGQGFLYLEPKETRVISYSFSGNREFLNIGLIERGTAYITTFPNVLMGYHDRVTFLDMSAKYSEILEFNKNKSSKSHRPINKIVMVKGDGLDFDIEKDFKITKDGRFIEYMNLTELPDGTKLSVLYLTPPSYIVIDLVHELRATFVKFKYPQETFTELPKQYVIKREDFVYGSNFDSG